MQSLVQIDLSNTDGEITTTSLEIARVFERPHKDVMSSIRSMGCSEEFTERNFSLSEFKDSTGRTLPSYIITRNGFDFLAMGFTGEKAAKYKEAYINEFSRMERSLRAPQLPSPIAPPASSLIQEASVALAVYHGVAKLFGLKDNQALLSANAAVERNNSINFIEHMQLNLPAPVQAQTYVPTELGKMLEKSVGPRRVNTLLANLGLQESYKDHRDNVKWKLLEKGETYGEYLDTGKVSGGVPVKQIKWYDTVLPLLEEELEFALYLVQPTKPS